MSIQAPQFSGPVLDGSRFSDYWQRMLAQLFRQVNNPQETLFSMVPRTFASLPTGIEGMVAFVSDSTTNTWGATVAGGGANKVLCWFRGGNWRVFAV